MTEDPLCATVRIRGVICGPDAQVLLLQRCSDTAWELPGGRLASGENPAAGLDREIREETGLSVDIETICCVDSWINDSGQDRFAAYYLCTAASTSVTLSAEHVDAQWVTPSEAVPLLSNQQLMAVNVAAKRAPQTLSMPDPASRSAE
jgi:8-oxo-dGTP pyrophosphatase MutT (NUDIX family)